MWNYINVRRLFIFLEESLDEGTQPYVFEPNDERLWARIRDSVTIFLTRIWRDGALMGSKPEEAFFVRCDRSTHSDDDILNGRLVMEIGIAPVRPAEFVVIRIGQWLGGSSRPRALAHSKGDQAWQSEIGLTPTGDSTSGSSSATAAPRSRRSVR